VDLSQENGHQSDVMSCASTICPELNGMSCCIFGNQSSMKIKTIMTKMMLFQFGENKWISRDCYSNPRGVAFRRVVWEVHQI
jgi:hypothetical protein